MLGFVTPLFFVAAVWKINTADGQMVNFLNMDAWIPRNFEEEKMLPVIPMYVMALLSVVMAFVVPNLIGTSAAKNLPKSASPAVKTSSPNIWFLRLVLRVALLEMTTLLGFAAAVLAKQSELMMPFLLVTLIGAAMSSPEKFFENNFEL
jgi:hypothetical protein